MRPVHIAAMFVVALGASAQAHGGAALASDRTATQLAQPLLPRSKLAEVTPIESPPLPRPRPPMVQVAPDDPAALISAFRRQHGEGDVTPNAALTVLAQQQADAMAAANMLEHDVLAPFPDRMRGKGFNPSGENLAYGYTDFPNTLKQWIDSPTHLVILLMPGAKLVGVARASNSRRTYWAMIIGNERVRKDSATVRPKPGSASGSP